MSSFVCSIYNWFSGKQAGVRLKNSSADRNCQPILDCLHHVLEKNQYGLRLLEISSGTGQHVAHFAPAFPNVAFFPSEYDTSMFGSIRSFTETLSNVALPMTIDIRQPFGKWNWHVANLQPTKVAGTFDYMLNINMIHITPWSCTEGLFKNASGLLKPNGIMLTYGPYASNGKTISFFFLVQTDENIFRSRIFLLFINIFFFRFICKNRSSHTRKQCQLWSISSINKHRLGCPWFTWSSTIGTHIQH